MCKNITCCFIRDIFYSFPMNGGLTGAAGSLANNGEDLFLFLLPKNCN